MINPGSLINYLVDEFHLKTHTADVLKPGTLNPTTMDLIKVGLLKLHSRNIFNGCYQAVYDWNTKPEVKKMVEGILTSDWNMREHLVKSYENMFNRNVGLYGESSFISLMHDVIRSVEGISKPIVLYRFMHSKHDWRKQSYVSNNQELFINPVVTCASRLESTRWNPMHDRKFRGDFKDMIIDPAVDFDMKVMIECDHYDFNYTGNLSGITESGLDEYEVVIAPFSVFQFIGETSAVKGHVGYERVLRYKLIRNIYEDNGRCDNCLHTKISSAKFSEIESTIDEILKFSLIRGAFYKSENRIPMSLFENRILSFFESIKISSSIDHNNILLKNCTCGKCNVNDDTHMNYKV